MTLLYLARHGETIDNARAIMQGQTPGNLNEKGIRQAFRLKEEMALLESAILDGSDIRSVEAISKHADWVDEWRSDYDLSSPDKVSDAIKTEIGKTFTKILGCAGVFKNEDDMMRFISTL